MTKRFLVVTALTALAMGACSKPDDAARKAAPEAPEAAATARATPAEAANAEPAAAAEEAIAEVSVAELATWRADGKVKVSVFDANGPDTRASVGVIPDAVLLKDYSACKNELPAEKDQKLVFYCYNEMCGASHAAAKIALDEGFEDVSVLTAGIMGWKNAGQPVKKL